MVGLGLKEDGQFSARQKTSGEVITSSSLKRRLTSLDRERWAASPGKGGLVKFKGSSCPASLEFTHKIPS